MTKYQSKSVSNNRKLVEALNPCQRYTTNAGINPFQRLLDMLMLEKMIEGKTKEQSEKQVQHELKMASDQKSAKARQNRKRNKV